MGRVIPDACDYHEWNKYDAVAVSELDGQVRNGLAAGRLRIGTMVKGEKGFYAIIGNEGDQPVARIFRVVEGSYHHVCTYRYRFVTPPKKGWK